MTKEMYAKIIRFKKKWHDLKFLATANIFFVCVERDSTFIALNRSQHSYGLSNTRRCGRCCFELK